MAQTGTWWGNMANNVTQIFKIQKIPNIQVAGQNWANSLTNNIAGQFVCPPGVTQISVTVPTTPKTFDQNSMQATAIDTQGRLYSWGSNAFASLGDATVVSKSSPSLASGGLVWSQMIGMYGSGPSQYGITTNGNLYAWGINGNGQLGDGTTSTRSSPMLVPGGLQWLALQWSLGSANSGNVNMLMGLTTTGALYSWGAATGGILGTTGNLAVSSPNLVSGGQTWASFMLAGAQPDAYAINTAGALYAWGVNSNGQLGDGTTSARSSPTLVLGGLLFSVVVGDGISTFGITTTGALYAWGSNTFGQLGDGTVTKRSSPVLVGGGLVWSSVAYYNGSVTGITTTGKMYGWGANAANSYNIGVGTQTSAYSSPTLVPGGLQWASCFMNLNNTFALTIGGALYSWGTNASGQIGDGTISTRSSPTLVSGGVQWAQYWSNSDSGGQGIITQYGLSTTGQLYGWGTNASGQLGDGTTSARSSPTLVLGGLVWSALSLNIGGNILSGGSLALGVTNQGQLYAWGSNLFGAVGNNTTTAAFSSPVLVVGGLLPAVVPTIAMQTLTVVPGTTYPVYIGPAYASIGPFMVGQGLVDSVQISYQQ
jgi:alpha-tubulin suppressor-like RCC1 family protein